MKTTLLPYKKIRIESDFSCEEIKGILEKEVCNSDWQITLDKVLNHRVTEGKIFDSSFLIVRGKYGLTYGRTSLLPIMKGIYYFDQKKSKTIISVTIRPYKAGIFILSFFYLLLLTGIIANIHKLTPQFIIVSSIFFCTTYFSVLKKFSAEAQYYQKFILENF